MNVEATHIVGGEVTYTCLGQLPNGNSRFEIRLTIFRDCINGNPNAYFDDPASIGIFDEDNNLITALGFNGQLLMDLVMDDTLDPVLSNPCLVVPPDVCVHTTTYRDTLELPWRAGGYLLAYQRCCRNQTLLNIVDPLATGATYSVLITEQALEECNSSAKFVNWPPIYICANEPIDFDQSAIDTDGDSIVYRLCTPLQGADQAVPMPQPPNNPPYQEVVWIDPPYNLDNMLNGTPGVPLRIDPETGFLTGIPNTVGQFVVGICLEEYRNGQLISTTRRDFQYNVGVCGATVSAFFAPQIQCTGLEVDFENQSANADEYLWYFNDPGNPGATSTDADPTFTFSDTGHYTIMLIAEPGNQCVDTAYREIYLQYPSLTVDYDLQLVECSDSMVIAVTSLATDSISQIISHEWEMNKGGTLIASSNEVNPVFVVHSSQTVTLTLTVTAANGCVQTIDRTFTINLIEVELPADSLFICPGDSVSLNPDSDTSYEYNWGPAGSLDDATSPNPLAFPTSTTTYSVTISDQVDFCMVQRQITVVVPDQIAIDMPPDTTICSQEFLLEAHSDQAGTYEWFDDALLNNLIGNEASILVSPMGAQTYFLVVTDAVGCSKLEDVTLAGNAVDITTSGLSVICDGDQVQLSLANEDATDTLSFIWSPDTYILSGINTDAPVVQPPGPGTWVFYVDAANQLGCTTLDSAVVAVLDTTSQADFVAEQQCSGYSIQFTNTSINAGYYTWHFGDPSNPSASSDEANPEYIYPGPGSYTVSLVPWAECADSIVKTITVAEPQINLDFDWAYENCGDSIVIAFQDLSTNGQSNFTSWLWIFSNGDTSQLQNPLVTINTSQLLTATLQLISDDGCEDTLSQDLLVELIEVNLADSLQICPGTASPLNPNGNTSYQYEWSPATGLSDPNAVNPIASPSESTLYEVAITNFNGADTCSILQSVYVFVPPPIELQASNDTMICGSQIELWAHSDQANSYEWSDQPNFGNILGTDSLLLATAGRPGNFYVRVTDTFGCQRFEEVIVFSGRVELQPNNYSICEGDTLGMEVINLHPEDMNSYSWSPVEQIISGANTAMPLISPLGDVVYTVTVTNEFGCSAEESVFVEVNEQLSGIFITPPVDTIVNGSSIQLTATFDPTYIYNWSPPATLSNPNIHNPLASPTTTTTYTLEVSDGNNCPTEARVIIVVLDLECIEPFVFLPNAFTPNADGENDELLLYGSLVDEMYLAIYNRWGQKVFETDDQLIGWDGTFEGKQLNSDVFGYYLRVKCIGGEEYFKKGNITLLR